jgi:hypothetical protein
MLRLHLDLAPRWVDVGHGVRLFCAPCTAGVMADAGGSAGVAEAQAAKNSALITHRMAKRVGQLVIKAWEGVGDTDGTPVEPTPEWIEALFDTPSEVRQSIVDAFCDAVLLPAMRIETEKNVSGPSPIGTSAAGQTIAVPATGSATTAPAMNSGRKRSRAPKPGN